MSFPGGYLYINSGSASLEIGQNVYLVSPAISPRKTKCLLFYYYVSDPTYRTGSDGNTFSYGDVNSTLTVYQELYPYVWKPLASYGSTVTDRTWQSATVVIPTFPTQFNILFEFVLADRYTSDMAIARISLTDCTPESHGKGSSQRID